MTPNDNHDLASNHISLFSDETFKQYSPGMSKGSGNVCAYIRYSRNYYALDHHYNVTRGSKHEAWMQIKDNDGHVVPTIRLLSPVEIKRIAYSINRLDIRGESSTFHGSAQSVCLCSMNLSSKNAKAKEIWLMRRDVERISKVMKSKDYDTRKETRMKRAARPGGGARVILPRAAKAEAVARINRYQGGV